MFENPLFWLVVVVVFGFLIYRRRRENTPYEGAEPPRVQTPEEGVVRVSRSSIVDPGSHANPRGEIVSKPGSLRIPTVASAEREADRKRRSDSSGGDGIVLMNSSPYTSGKTTKAVDTDSDGSGDGDGGGGCGD